MPNSAMQLDQVYLELEKHQGKFFTLHQGHIVIADNQEKIYEKVGGKCMTKQIPELKGHFAWRAQITQALDELNSAPPPEPALEDQIRPDTNGNGLELQVEEDSTTVFSKLKRLFRK